MRYIKENKWSLIFDAVIVLSFATFDPTPKNYFLVVFLLAFVLFFKHLQSNLEERSKAMREGFHKMETRTLIGTIESLSMEIVYPTMSQETKKGLLNEVAKMKRVVLGETLQ